MSHTVCNTKHPISNTIYTEHMQRTNVILSICCRQKYECSYAKFIRPAGLQDE